MHFKFINFQTVVKMKLEFLYVDAKCFDCWPNLYMEFIYQHSADTVVHTMPDQQQTKCLFPIINRTLGVHAALYIYFICM